MSNVYGYIVLFVFMLGVIFYVLSKEKENFEHSLKEKTEEIKEMQIQIDSLINAKSRIDTVIISKNKYIKSKIKELDKDTFTFHSLPLK